MFKIADLKCCELNNPIGIDNLKPNFSWRLLSDKRNTIQTAYQIVVLDEKDEVVWDSGKITSEASIAILYEGVALKSRGIYNWKVRVYDNYGRAYTSSKAYFEMGLLEEKDWKAEWIEADFDRKPSKDSYEFYKIFTGELCSDENAGDNLNPCVYLKKPFYIKEDANVKKARVYATAHGVYELSINGEKVNNLFDPGFTPYENYLEYQTFDVTAYLNNGTNVINSIVADGWYLGKISLVGIGNQYGDNTAFLMQLEIEYEDSTVDIIGTDAAFKYNFGALAYSDIFVGEKYDARNELENFYDASIEEYKNVTIKEYGYKNLKGSSAEPVKVLECFKPKELIITPKGEQVIDVGQVISGRIVVKVRGKAGSSITLQHSEVLDKEGNFLFNIMGQNKNQADTFILKGIGEEIFEPKFTFHGFRYVKISTDLENIELDNFKVVVIGSDIQKTFEFECSDERLNQLQSNIYWSQKGNMLSVPTDCPQRERAGWTGDIQVYAPTACYNMNVKAFLSRWLRYLRAEQLEDGQIPNTIPYTKGDKLFNSNNAAASTAGWSDACIIVPWILYKQYGDIEILKENFNCMLKWIQYVEKEAAEKLPEGIGELDEERRERQRYLWNTGFHFGDWLIPSVKNDFGQTDAMKSAMLTKELAATCMYAYSTDLMSKICEALGKYDLSVYYRDLNGKIQNAFAVEYVSEDGSLDNELQGLYVLAIKMGMDKDKGNNMIKRLVNLIEKNGKKLDTGFLSIPFLLDVLTDNGYKELAYDLLYQNQCPSWLYEVENGATTIWEAWDAILPDGTVRNVSFNHYAFGCVGDWIYRNICGINMSGVGFKNIILKPDLNSRLDWAYGKYNSIYGEVSCRWELDRDNVLVQVEIPANTTGVVHLPNYRSNLVMDSKEVDETLILVEGNTAIIELGSGRYEFRYKCDLQLS